ncbi:hypothetical protein HDU76_008356 [Blyttiomyces sp. JEL0837]|nr:hypothetical protein HDU76_008356 [Blyttiomyces sp. JEL0837]
MSRRGSVEVAVSIPAWKSRLEASIQANKSVPQSSYVQLATVRPDGRPSNRTIVFRGFWNPADRALFQEAEALLDSPIADSSYSPDRDSNRHHAHPHYPQQSQSQHHHESTTTNPPSNVTSLSSSQPSISTAATRITTIADALTPQLMKTASQSKLEQEINEQHHMLHETPIPVPHHHQASVHHRPSLNTATAAMSTTSPIPTPTSPNAGTGTTSTTGIDLSRSRSLNGSYASLNNNSTHTPLSTHSHSSSGFSTPGGGHNNPAGWLVAAKLACLLEFVTDVRSAKCGSRDETSLTDGHGGLGMGVGVMGGNAVGMLAEVCWYFPVTREQYRLSGRLYLIASPDEILATSTHPPWAPRDTPFERERRRLWKSISPSLRASFTGNLSAVPGSPWKPTDSADDAWLESLECLLEEDEMVELSDGDHQEERKVENGEKPHLTSSSVSPTTTSTTYMAHPTPGSSPTRRSQAPKPLLAIHDEAFSRFGVLMLDVDCVDHLDLGSPAASLGSGGALAGGNGRGGIRTISKMVVPGRTYGRISGLVWEEKRVHA